MRCTLVMYTLLVVALLCSSLMASADVDVYKHFTKWLDEKGVTGTSALLLATMSGGYRGAVAAHKLEKGTPFLQIPSDLLLSDNIVDNEFAESTMANEALQVWERLGYNLISERARGETSKWSMYIQTLPKEAVSTLSIKAEQIAQELHGTQVRDLFSASWEQYRNFSDTLCSFAHKHIALLPSHLNKADFNREACDWGVSMSRSRAFYIAELGTTNLVPFADMCNHRQGAMQLYYNSTSETAGFTTEQRFDEGQEVVIAYGDAEVAEASASQYGFVQPEGGVALSYTDEELFGDPDAAPLDPNSIEAFRNELAGQSGCMSLWEAAGESTLGPTRFRLLDAIIACERMFNAPDEDEALQFIMDTQGTSMVSPSLEATALRRVHRFLTRRLESHPTTIEDDEALLAGSSVAPSRRLLVELRLHEKRFIMEYLVELKEKRWNTLALSYTETKALGDIASPPSNLQGKEDL